MQQLTGSQELNLMRQAKRMEPVVQDHGRSPAQPEKQLIEQKKLTPSFGVDASEEVILRRLKKAAQEDKVAETTEGRRQAEALTRQRIDAKNALVEEGQQRRVEKKARFEETANNQEQESFVRRQGGVFFVDDNA